MASSFSAAAELEHSLIVERAKAGLRNARAKGKRLGSRAFQFPRPRFGSCVRNV